jgi:hypothetical protein
MPQCDIPTDSDLNRQKSVLKGRHNTAVGVNPREWRERGTNPELVTQNCKPIVPPRRGSNGIMALIYRGSHPCL